MSVSPCHDPYAHFPRLEKDEVSQSPPYSVALDARNKYEHKIEKSGSKFINLSINRLKLPCHFDQSPTAQPHNVMANTAESEKQEDVHEGPRPTKRIPDEDAVDWPHPKCCPLIRHNIKMDIPRRCRPLVRVSYNIWKLSSIGLMWDLASIIAASLNAETHGWPSNNMSMKAMTITGLVVGAAISLLFFLRHMSLYRLLQFQSNHRCNLYSFASIFSIQMIGAFWMMVGLPWDPISICPSGFLFIKFMVQSEHGMSVLLAMAAVSTTIWMTVFFVGFSIIRGVYRELRMRNMEKQSDAMSQTEQLEI